MELVRERKPEEERGRESCGLWGLVAESLFVQSWSLWGVTKDHKEAAQQVIAVIYS